MYVLYNIDEDFTAEEFETKDEVGEKIEELADD